MGDDLEASSADSVLDGAGSVEEDYGTPELGGLPLRALSTIYDQLDAEDVSALAGTNRRIRGGYMKSGDSDVWKKCVAPSARVLSLTCCPSLLFFVCFPSRSTLPRRGALCLHWGSPA